MGFLFLIFMFATHINAALPLLQEDARCEVTTLITRMKNNKISSLEVKYIFNHPSIVVGRVFEVQDEDFWKAFAHMLQKAKFGVFVCERSFESHLLRVLDQAPIKKNFEKLDMLCRRHWHEFFPGDAPIRWIAGPVDWILENKVPGSVTLYPGTGNYSLHFVPNLKAPNPAEPHPINPSMGIIKEHLDNIRAEITQLKADTRQQTKTLLATIGALSEEHLDNIRAEITQFKAETRQQTKTLLATINDLSIDVSQTKDLVNQLTEPEPSAAASSLPTYVEVMREPPVEVMRQPPEEAESTEDIMREPTWFNTIRRMFCCPQ